MFNFDLWMKAFEEANVDPHFYNRDIPLHEVLPWEFIDIGVSKKFLLKERQRSYEQVQTYDCKWGDCRGCGIPGNYADIRLAEVPDQVVQESLVQIRPGLLPPAPAKNLPSTTDKSPSHGLNAETSTPYVLHYWKEGPARLLSHLNIMQLMERAMIRSGLRLRFTEGFNPHPKFATSPAIPLGMSSRSEYLQFELHGELPSEALQKMNECLIEGLEVKSIVPIEPKSPWKVTQPLQVTYRASLSEQSGELRDILGRVNDLINHLSDHYKGNDFYCNSKDHERIVDLWVENNGILTLGFTVSVNPDNGALLKPREFLEQSLGCSSELARKFVITKEAVNFLPNQRQYPLDRSTTCRLARRSTGVLPRCPAEHSAI
jgi:radical SAM-linked protein